MRFQEILLLNKTRAKFYIYNIILVNNIKRQIFQNRKEVVTISHEEVPFCATIKWETGANEYEGAYLLSDGDNEFWVPKSQIIKKHQMKDSDYEFVIPEWLALDKGII